jgi:hypothetical protein
VLFLFSFSPLSGGEKDEGGSCRGPRQGKE